MKEKFKKIKARAVHKCIKCEQKINVGEFYYAEQLEQKFLYSLHNKKLCQKCYQKLNKNKIN